MRKTIGVAVAAALLASAAFAPVAFAQIDLSTTTTTVDPITKLKPDDWAKLMTSVLNGKSVVGRPEVFVINATGRELNAVVCDGKWQLVGPNPYNKGAPASLPAWKVTIVPTTGFDGYCKSSIVAQSDTGETYKASLVSVDNTFTNATFITFKP